MANRRGAMRAMLSCVMALAVLNGSIVSAPAKADVTDAASAADKFRTLAADHRRNLGDLHLKRGLPPPDFEADVSIDRVTEFLNKRIGQPAPYPNGSAVLFYAQSDSSLSIFLIGQSGLIAHDEVSIARPKLSALVSNFRASLGVDSIKRSRAPRWRGDRAYAPFVGPERHQFERDIKALSSTLLPPEIAAGLSDVQHLIIVANGEIASNPFSALTLGKDTLVVDRMSVSISASLFDVDQMIRPWSGRASLGKMLIFGDPLVPKSPDWDVPGLPGAAQEARSLADRLELPAFIGPDAAKSRFVSDARGATSLYIAAHATSDPREPLTGGFLMLSGPDADGAFLRAKEVQTMGLRANLVVLSACQTGLGMAHEGGTIGLARSFQKGGVPRVVMSLWSVSDEATVHLMDRFAAHMLEHTPSEALRLAMLDARKKYDDPSLWAPFTLFGTPR